MNDAFTVRRFQSGGKLDPKAQNLRLEHAGAGEFRIKGDAGYIFCHQKICLILSIEVEDNCDVGMIQLRESQRLFPQLLSRGRIGERARRQDLQRDIAIKRSSRAR